MSNDRVDAESKVSRSQVPIPARIRRELDIDDGDTLRWTLGDDGTVRVRVVQQRTGTFSDFEGYDGTEETKGDHGWYVMAAGTTNGLGDDPTFARTVATPRPVHRGTICNSGTICQAQGVDRRLGDFFTSEIDNTGRMWIGYPDTRQGGAVCLPGFVWQTDGMYFYEQDGSGRRGRPLDQPGRGRGRGNRG